VAGRWHVRPDRIEDALGQLHRVGWSIGSTAFHSTGGGLVWLVSGLNGENLIRAEGATETEAWVEAVGQARAVGIPAGVRPGEPRAG
jgi:hypothetical protein